MEVSGKVVVVTGGGAGIGAALVREAVARGASGVAVVDADGERAASIADEVGGRAFTCDVASYDAVAAMADQVVDELGVPGLVCANAGVNGAGGPLVRIDPGDAAWVVGVNLLGVWHTCAAFGRVMRAAGDGWILATGSEHSLGVPHLRGGIYTATKHAVLGMCDVLRRELAGTVGVSVLVPGLVSTQLWNGGRLRPDELGGPVEPRAGSDEMMQRGLAPSVVAGLALDGVAREAFVIATHPHARAYAEARWREVEAAFDHLDSLGLDLPDLDVTRMMSGD